MTASQYLDRLQAALRIAADLDANQEHDRAADCLQEAIDAGGPWDGTEDPVLLDVAKAAQECGQERDRQRLRAARLKAYLQL